MHQLSQQNCNLVLNVPGAGQSREKLLLGDELDTPEPTRAEAFVSEKVSHVAAR
jgi:hypothetical protein